MNLLSKKASWISWIALFLAYLYMAIVVMGGASDAVNKVANDPSCAIPLDLQLFGISADAAYKSLDCMGEEGRKIYKSAVTREDILYPITYTLFFIYTLFVLSSFCTKNKIIIVGVTFIPLLSMVSDFAENYYIVKLVNQFPVLSVQTVTAFSIANSLKWGILFPVLFLILFFSGWSVRVILSRKNKQAPK